MAHIVGDTFSPCTFLIQPKIDLEPYVSSMNIDSLFQSMYETVAGLVIEMRLFGVKILL
jgi:hypothetical protein